MFIMNDIFDTESEHTTYIQYTYRIYPILIQLTDDSIIINIC